MKKSLLALAVLGAFAGAASAQSSVTIFGSIDLAVMKGNGGTAANSGVTVINATDPKSSKAWFLQQSHASRLGFRGNEDLGGGLSAQFNIEHRFTPDDGQANAAAFWYGRSYVQLTSAAAGSVYLGRDYIPAFYPAVNSDPFGWDGVGQLGFMQFAGYESSESSGTNFRSRTQNTVGYKSPNLGGLKVQAAVGLGEGTQPGGRDVGFNAEYAAGPIYAAFGYDKTSDGTLARTDGNSLLNLALHYDFGVAKIIGYYARAKVGPNSDFTNKFYELGARVPIGAGVLKAVYGRLSPEAFYTSLTASNNAKKTKLAVGYDYFLSKRTNVYADLGMGKEDTKTNNRAYAFGIRHDF